eukprot:Ihof_evm46s1 gene=Ihof_evmTU46s1
MIKLCNLAWVMGQWRCTWHRGILPINKVKVLGCVGDLPTRPISFPIAASMSCDRKMELPLGDKPFYKTAACGAYIRDNPDIGIVYRPGTPKLETYSDSNFMRSYEELRSMSRQ